jgi:hypothetical protein
MISNEASGGTSKAMPEIGYTLGLVNPCVGAPMSAMIRSAAMFFDR